MAFDLGNLLQQYMGGAAGADNTRAEEDFERVTQAAPREAVAHGVTQALRSDQTPPFPQMVGQMFGQSNPNQQAGMLNQLIAAAGPSLLGMLSGRGGAGVGGMGGGMGAGMGGLGGMLGNLLGGAGGGQPQITPEQASQLSPEQVQEIAQKAEQENPGVVERMGDFYAEHPNIVKGLGGAALAIALAHMAQGMRR
jgi:membrane protease subunit (stomatin/prohibitin family)